MQLVGARGQANRDFLFDASGTITTGNTAQLLLPEQRSRTLLLIVNNSSAALYVDFGGARATAQISGGVVTGFTVTNGGQGYTMTPSLTCFGGGPVEGNAGANLGAGLPDWAFCTPPNFATGEITMSGSAPNKVVASIAVTNPGSGYIKAPYVQLRNSHYDPNGVVTASAAGGSIPLLTQGATLSFEGTGCPTDPICIFGGTSTQAFTCKYMI